MRIFVDDGSTNIKLAWVEDGAVKTLISPNSFKPEWSMTLQGLTDATREQTRTTKDKCS